MSTTTWHDIETAEILIELDTTFDGLSSNEVINRQEKYGFNKLQEPEKTSAFIRFLSQYHDPLNYLLIMAAVVALALPGHNAGDAIFIFIVLTANAVFGFWQEGQAEQAMGALKQMSVSQCVVIREGVDVEVSTHDLIPGDIVKLEEGLNVPADVRIVESFQCKIDESPLTGESLTVRKNPDVCAADTILAERKNMAYMGTCVATIANCSEKPRCLCR